MKKGKIPHINIAYNKFIDPLAKEYSLRQEGWKDWTPPSIEEVKDKVEVFKSEWKKNEEDILKGITQALSLDFQREVLDVYIVSGLPYSFSNPIVLKSGYSPTDFVDVLTHELVHVLMQQNNMVVSWDFVNWVKGMYPDESHTVRNHIAVHAVLKYVYIDILKDEERLKRNRKRSLGHGTGEYTRAWDIVDEYGYKEFLQDMQEQYTK